MKEIPEELIKFMALFYAKKHCWIGPGMSVCENHDYFNFIEHNDVNGLVVFGDYYPLHNLDLPIEDHLSVFNAIKKIKPDGIAYSLVDKNGKEYEPDDLDKWIYAITDHENNY